MNTPLSICVTRKPTTDSVGVRRGDSARPMAPAIQLPPGAASASVTRTAFAPWTIA